MANWTYDDVPDQTGKRVVITGANHGLGKALAKDFLERTKVEKVIMACRSKERAEAAMLDLGADPRLEFLSLDLADLESVRKAADELNKKYDRIDTLVLNAGLLSASGKQKTKDGFEMTIGVCHLGHFAFTARVWPLLLKSAAARIVPVSSMAHTWAKKGLDFDDLNWERRKFDALSAYNEAKLANIYFTKEIGKRASAAGIANVSATSCSPGFGASGLTRDLNCLWKCVLRCCTEDCEKLSLNTLRAATDPTLKSGDYLCPKRMDFYGPPVVKPSAEIAQDESAAARLWAKSEELTGQTFAMAPMAWGKAP